MKNHLKRWLQKRISPGGFLWHMLVLPQRIRRHGFKVFLGPFKARKTKKLVEPLKTRQFKKDHVSIVITSAGRKEYLKKTIEALRKYFEYDLSKMSWLIIDDYPASQETRYYIESLSFFDRKVFNEKNQGLGYSLNRIFSEIDTEFVFYCQDDFELLRPFSVKKMIQILRKNSYLRQLMLPLEWKSLIRLRSTSRGYAEYTQMFGFTPHLASMEFFRETLPFPFYFTNVEFGFQARKKGWPVSGVFDSEGRHPYVRHIGEKRKVPVVK